MQDQQDVRKVILHWGWQTNILAKLPGYVASNKSVFTCKCLDVLRFSERTTMSDLISCPSTALIELKVTRMAVQTYDPPTHHKFSSLFFSSSTSLGYRLVVKSAFPLSSPSSISIHSVSVDFLYQVNHQLTPTRLTLWSFIMFKKLQTRNDRQPSGDDSTITKPTPNSRFVLNHNTRMLDCYSVINFFLHSMLPQSPGYPVNSYQVCWVACYLP